MWINFRAGVARGFGVTVGMTVVLGILVWVLTMLVDLPLVGDYFRNAEQYVSEYAENTNYKEDFAEKLAKKCDLSQAKAQEIISTIFDTKAGKGIIAIEISVSSSHDHLRAPRTLLTVHLSEKLEVMIIITSKLCH